MLCIKHSIFTFYRYFFIYIFFAIPGRKRTNFTNKSRANNKIKNREKVLALDSLNLLHTHTLMSTSTSGNFIYHTHTLMSASTSGNLDITPTPWCQPLPQVTLYITPTHSCQPLAQVTLCHTLILTSTSVYFIGSGLWCLTPLSTIFHLYRGGQSYWWRKQGYSEKIHWLAVSHRQTLLHNVVLSTPRLNRIRTHNVDDDRHWLQLPYDHDHDGPWSKLYISYPDVNICLW